MRRSFRRTALDRIRIESLRSLAGSGSVCTFAVALVAMFLSSNDPAGHVNGVSTFNRINWCDSHNSRFAENAMPLNQLVGDVNADSNECKTQQKRSRSRHVGSGAVQVMAEDIAESAIDACIESGANRIKGEETDSAGARRPCQGRRYRVQTWNELGHQQEG